MIDDRLTEPLVERLVERLAEQLRRRGWRCVSAESCTGGGVAATLTAVAGSSDWFDRGFVTYSNQAKIEMLGVAADTIHRHGAVSPQTALEMAVGALHRSQAQAAMAVTGIAGPSGGSLDKPVGTVIFAWAMAGRETDVERRWVEGDRAAVRVASIEHALEGLLRRLSRDWD